MTRSKLFPLLVLPVCLSACSGGGSGGAAVEKPFPSNAPSTPHSPHLSGMPSTVAIEGAAYTFKPNASDPDGDPLTFAIDNCPPWASFDPATGALEGMPTPNDVGLYAGVQIRVSDGTSWVALPAFDVMVQTVSNGAV